MTKNKVSDLITDQEMAFARLVLSGTMTDRDAAEAAGLNPDTAAYTKAKPRVRAYMLEHRAAMEQQRLQQEADLSRLAVEEQRRKEERREQLRERVLDRLWEIAGLNPEMTRGSITGQVKAIQMIVAIEGLIPDRRAGSAKRSSVPAPIEPQPSPALAQQEDDPIVPEPNPVPTPGADLPPHPVPTRPTFAGRLTPPEVPQPYVPRSILSR